MFSQIVVTGTYLTQNNTPAAGAVTFLLSNTMMDSTTEEMVAPTPITVTLDSNGHFSVSIFANTDATTQPANTFYIISEYIQGGGNRSFDVVISASAPGGTVDLSSLAPTTSTPTYTYLLATNNLSDLTNTATARNNLGLGSASLLSTTGICLTINNLSDLTSASTARGNLGLGSAATQNSSAFDVAGAAAAVQAASLQKASNLSDLTNTTSARSNLGLGSAATASSGAFDVSGAAATAQAASLQKASNLSDLTNAATARSNLGLGTAATQDTSAFDVAGAAATAQAASLQKASNLSDLASASTARSNLGLGSASVQNTNFFLQTGNNLSDLTNASTARSNLGLGSIATSSSGSFLQTANNLSDLTNTTSARSNLGLGTAATQDTSAFDASGAASAAQAASLQKTNNLSDLTNASTARSNLGLGGASLLSTTGVCQTTNNLSDLTSASSGRSNLGLGTAALLNATAIPPVPIAKANEWMGTPITAATSTLSMLQNQMYCTPIVFGDAASLKTIGINIISAAGGTPGTFSRVRLGIYRDDGTGNLSPGSLLIEATTGSALTTGAVNITISQTLPAAGLYWLAGVWQTDYTSPSAPSVTAHVGTSIALPTSTATPYTAVTVGYAQVSVSGSLPNPAVISRVGTQTNPRILVQHS